jgi:hypothetical protein
MGKYLYDTKAFDEVYKEANERMYQYRTHLITLTELAEFINDLASKADKILKAGYYYEPDEMINGND